MRATYRQVIDRPCNSQCPDIRAWEEQRVHDVGIGREGQPITAGRECSERQYRAILRLDVAESFGEHILDEGPHGFPTTAMR